MPRNSPALFDAALAMRSNSIRDSRMRMTSVRGVVLHTEQEAYAYASSLEEEVVALREGLSYQVKRPLNKCIQLPKEVTKPGTNKTVLLLP